MAITDISRFCGTTKEYCGLGCQSNCIKAAETKMYAYFPRHGQDIDMIDTEQSIVPHPVPGL